MGRSKNPNPQRKEIQVDEGASPSHRYQSSCFGNQVSAAIPVGAANGTFNQSLQDSKVRKRKCLIAIEKEQERRHACTEPRVEEELGEILVNKTDDGINTIGIHAKQRVNTIQTWRLLRRQVLAGFQVQLLSDGSPVADVAKSYFLNTARGTADLLGLFCGDGDNVSAVGLAVEDGTMAVQLEWNELSTISIMLTTKALEIASPSRGFMGPAGIGRRSKKFQPVGNLQRALAIIFPDTIVSQVLMKPSSQSPVTAKMVYDLVDNVQIDKYEKSGGYDAKPMFIEGLIPKLRPYQEAAVQWMLQRENGTVDQNEWELAWVVLTQTNNVLPLSKHMTGDVVVYCPFAGWLVSSYCEARETSRGEAPVRGGILAESMGLGKTVEVIACILANPCPWKPERLHMNFHREGIEDVGCSEAASSSLPVSDVMTINRLGVCICGIDRPFKGSLSFVLCRSCEHPLHGACAGFASNEEIVAETVPDFFERNDGTEAIVRLCSHDRCPTCYSTKSAEGLVKSRATLIVTPSAILDQWEREIQKHASMDIRMDSTMADGVPITGMPKNVPLKVIVYRGIRNVFRHSSGAPSNPSGQRECRLVHPRFLADADVVLTTFDALMGDLGHSSENPYIDDDSLRLRGRKRYRVVPSPLARIKWWRVCLDEAQRVEVPTATSARMALQLEAEHRWCISGTPIGRGKLEDLHGLFVFLRLEPFASKLWFQACLQPGYMGTMSRVQQLLQDVLWRSTKSNEGVRTQMGIPAQVEKKIVLRFSSIERHFYDRQLEQTMLAASELIGKKATSKRKHQEGDLVSQHLHRLRAACCHPQVGSTGLGWSVNRRNAHSTHVGDHENSIGSGVLTMSQILDKLIEDAKHQCEESQRLAVMHTNAMAALWRLKVAARQHGITFVESDQALLKRSCDLYMEALNLTEKNAMPSNVIGEAVLTGCRGFLTPRKVVRDGVSTVQWKVNSDDVALSELWSRYDFDGPPKNICQLTIASINVVPTEFKGKGYRILHPKDCAFQVAHSSLGGSFVDVVSFTLDEGRCGQQMTLGGFRTNRSKAWRIVVKNFHDLDPCPSEVVIDLFVGLAVELFEPYIASDSIQRLHVLHNAAISVLSLLQARSADNDDVAKPPDESFRTCRIQEMQNECQKIESLYLDGARAIHAEVRRELQKATRLRTEAITDLSNACAKGTKRKISEMWHDTWWEDALSNCFLNGTPYEREQLCSRVQNDMDNFWQSQIGKDYRARSATMPLPRFQDVDGLQTALSLRISNYIYENGDMSHSTCMNKFSELSAFPSQVEQMENSHCHKCHMDWSQTGPECNHCKLETELLRNEPDAMILGILGSIWKWLKDSKNRGKMGSARVAALIDERAEKFFDVVKASEKEWQRAKKLWRVHLDLLNDIDEVNQCKQSMRLAQDGEDLTALTNDELNSVVFAVDIPSRLSDHSAKQAMALGTLRRHTQSLRFLRNLKIRESDDGKLIGAPNCIVCLSAMDGERAVLICGHSFHQECIKPLIAAKNNRAVIACPMRCTTKTTKAEIMIASDRCQHDGFQATRQIKGSWGTKVTKLLCDLADVSELGEKSIVFSQWEDMLWVVEQALLANMVEYVRVKNMKQIGEVIKRFRSKDCQVLLLNVKNGAEGLTLVEATHIFMVEPLLNCGLDSQAISRIHRIGQNRTTYVHRYLIEDTIEIKIDKLRAERQAEDQLEDSINDARQKHDVGGGGIDGGFTHGELHELLKA